MGRPKKKQEPTSRVEDSPHIRTILREQAYANLTALNKSELAAAAEDLQDGLVHLLSVVSTLEAQKMEMENAVQQAWRDTVNYALSDVQKIMQGVVLDSSHAVALAFVRLMASEYRSLAKQHTSRVDSDVRMIDELVAQINRLKQQINALVSARKAYRDVISMLIGTMRAGVSYVGYADESDYDSDEDHIWDED